MLISVPNVSEGRDATTLDAIAAAFGPGLIHCSSDPDHHRAVFTLAGEPGELHTSGARGRARGDRARRPHAATAASTRASAPSTSRRSSTSTTTRQGAACAEALVLADEIGQLGVPVYLYGELGGGRTRAELRKPGGLDHHKPDFGPRNAHPTAGATLVAARPPLVAFNVEIDAPLETAKRIAQVHPRRARRPRARPPAQPHASRSPRTSRTTPRSPRRRSSSSIRRHAHRHRRRARRARAARRARRTSRRTCRSGARSRSKIIYPRRRHGPDEAQEADQASRQRRGLDRIARPHRPQAHARRRARRPPQPAARRRKPPTWNSAALKALAMAVLLFILVKTGLLGNESTWSAGRLPGGDGAGHLHAAGLHDRQVGLQPHACAQQAQKKS